MIRRDLKPIPDTDVFIKQQQERTGDIDVTTIGTLRPYTTSHLPLVSNTRLTSPTSLEVSLAVGFLSRLLIGSQAGLYSPAIHIRKNIPSTYVPRSYAASETHMCEPGTRRLIRD